MDFVSDAHALLSQTVMLFFLLIGVWGIFEFMRGGEMGGSIGGAFVIGQVLVTVQVLLGVVMVIFGTYATDSVHYLYGISAIISLPFAWSYMRSRHPRQALLVYSLLALFIFGLAIRGVITGGE
jgi:hypothetical protein